MPPEQSKAEQMTAAMQSQTSTLEEGISQGIDVPEDPQKVIETVSQIDQQEPTIQVQADSDSKSEPEQSESSGPTRQSLRQEGESDIDSEELDLEDLSIVVEEMTEDPEGFLAKEVEEKFEDIRIFIDGFSKGLLTESQFTSLPEEVYNYITFSRLYNFKNNVNTDACNLKDTDLEFLIYNEMLKKSSQGELSRFSISEIDLSEIPEEDGRQQLIEARNAILVAFEVMNGEKSISAIEDDNLKAQVQILADRFGVELVQDPAEDPAEEPENQESKGNWWQKAKEKMGKIGKKFLDLYLPVDVMKGHLDRVGFYAAGIVTGVSIGAAGDLIPIPFLGLAASRVAKGLAVGAAGVAGSWWAEKRFTKKTRSLHDNFLTAQKENNEAEMLRIQGEIKEIGEKISLDKDGRIRSFAAGARLGFTVEMIGDLFDINPLTDPINDKLYPKTPTASISTPKSVDTDSDDITQNSTSIRSEGLEERTVMDNLDTEPSPRSVLEETRFKGESTDFTPESSTPDFTGSDPDRAYPRIDRFTDTVETPTEDMFQTVQMGEHQWPWRWFINKLDMFKNYTHPNGVTNTLKHVYKALNPDIVDTAIEPGQDIIMPNDELLQRIASRTQEAIDRSLAGQQAATAAERELDKLLLIGRNGADINAEIGEKILEAFDVKI